MKKHEEMHDETEAVRSATKKKEVEVVLSEPLEFNNETITKLTIKAPKGKHMMLLPKDPAMKDMLLLASKCSAIPMAIINELSGEDTLKVVEAVGELF